MFSSRRPGTQAPREGPVPAEGTEGHPEQHQAGGALRPCRAGQVHRAPPVHVGELVGEPGHLFVYYFLIN